MERLPLACEYYNSFFEGRKKIPTLDDPSYLQIQDREYEIIEIVGNEVCALIPIPYYKEGSDKPEMKLLPSWYSSFKEKGYKVVKK